MSTTLPLYWNLASPIKDERLDASVQLVNALQTFQHSHTVDTSVVNGQEEENDDTLDALNAQDVSYALRRLVRGLASPRESSRLGFAVALTELLSRIDTVSAGQMLDLVLSSTEITGSLTGQEERDMMFARLFGLGSIIESLLIVRESALPHSSNAISTLQDYQRLATEVMTLGERKSWFRESCWWTIIQAISTLERSNASFRSTGLNWIHKTIFVDNVEWTPEKVGIWLRFQSLWNSISNAPLKTAFKGKHVLITGNLPTLAKILKEVELEEEDSPKQGPGTWKPNPHFVWTIIMETYFPSDEMTVNQDLSSFQDFFRIVIDESIFSSTASPERKYIGFQLVEKALKTVPVSMVSHLFTKNFVRTWINQLAKQDRYLHKAALKLAGTVHKVVKEDASVGFPLVIQLLGSNGSRDFDRLSKTKTVETILSNMDVTQITEYVQFLLLVFEDGSEGQSKSTKESDQQWALEQGSALIRSNIVPKDDSWVHLLLEFFVKEGFFLPKKSKHKSNTAEIPDSTRASCRSKLFVALSELSSQAVAQHHDAKTSKFNGQKASGELWIIDAVKSFRQHGKLKELRAIFDTEEEATEARSKTWSTIKALEEVEGDKRDEAQGAILLLGANMLQSYRPITEDSGEDVIQLLEECTENVVRLLKISPKEKKRAKVNGVEKMNEDENSSKPIDLLVDTLIGYLEKPDVFMRNIAPQVFTPICPLIEASTIDLLLAQLQHRNLQEDASMEMDNESGGQEDEEDGSENENEDEDESSKSERTSDESSNSDDAEESAEEEEGDVDPEFRQKIAEALAGVAADEDEDEESDSDSSESLMDDDQMMQLDEKLAEVFRAHTIGNKSKVDAGLQREATHFKIRVLDFIDIFVRKCSSSSQIPRILLPLIQVAMKASADEQQLIEKTNGIIRKRLDSIQSIPSDVDLDNVAADLEEVHNIARKASHQQISPASLTSVSIYMSKVLTHHGRIDTVAKVYRDSLDDFMNRKGSKIYHTFFADSVKRIPSAMWAIRKDLVGACASERPVNTFRQMQAVHWTDALLSQALQVAANKPDECLATMLQIREVAYYSLRSAATDKHRLTVAQAKCVVKMALQAMRITNRVDPSAMDRVWDPQQLAAVVAEVQTSQKLTKGGGLMVIVRQMARRLGIEQQEGKKEKTKKRKASDDGAKDAKAKKKSKKKHVK